MASKRYLELLKSMEELHIKKNAGYAGESKDPWANFRLSEAFGVSPFLGCLVRMSDKFIRIQNLVKNPKNEQVGENIKDTLMDLAAYALIAICILEEDDEKSGAIFVDCEIIDTTPEKFLVIPFAHSGNEWYSDKMGVVFTVSNDVDPEMYKVISVEGKNDGKLIKKKDCRSVFNVKS